MNPSSVEHANQQVLELLRAGKMREAESLCRQILAQTPANATALHHLAIIATRAGQLLAAVELFNRAILLAPADAELRLDLSVPLINLGRRKEAIDTLRRAVELNPNLGAAFSNLGVVLAQDANAAEAEVALRRGAELQPQEAGTLSDLASVLRQLGRLDDAIDQYHKATQAGPGDAHAWSALGSCLRENGCIGQAIAAFRRAVSIDSASREIHSNLVYALYFDPGTTLQETFAAHQRWAAKFAEPLRAKWRPHSNDREPGRRLHIGYVSPDLRDHAIGWFMEPILAHHDHGQFEIFCYADVREDDEVARRLKGHADTWRMTAGMTDDALARQIREDRIDVLIDLTLHMRHNRLAMFALKPAPVQITHLAYCGTSGMSAMDYAIADPYLCPPGLNEQFFAEKLLRLPQTYWCYAPPDAAPAVGPLPAKANGLVTFGSLNSFAKVNDAVTAMWARIIAAVPDSHLLVHCVGGNDNRSARQRFLQAGIAADRLTLVGSQPREQYLATYNRIDIALDPFPYAGGTTSLDALWMGVPLVTLAGQNPVSRSGVSLLENLQLSDSIAQSPEQYIQTALGLASDLPRLEGLRLELRDRMQRSPLTDATRYVRNLEAAYRSAWESAARA